ncbi:phospholipase D-like domain-containing protein [Flavobacterium psychrotrophum]|uniref:phospholipase D-like domain-containing protein n=1 Tax=Flavobacterium psychrotrophum TaxID=2294119 RepID=UPI000E31AB0F|nr:phospholipase D-like domain-containing protein [Flavobacterium psychrotrophum]
MNKLFDYKALSAPQEDESSHGSYTAKYLVSQFRKVAALEQDLTRLPSEGEAMYLQSDSAFNAFTFIALITKVFPIKELHACTYSISRKVVDALIEMHDKGMVEQITLLINDGILSRNPATMDYLLGMAASRANIKVQYAWIHAKVALLKTHHAHFVVEGSGNWSDNAQYEQYTFVNDKQLYDFRMKLFTETNLKKY